MIGVMSLWTRQEARLGDFDSLCLWALSSLLAREHFEKLILITDSVGQATLVDELHLPFDEVKLSLDEFTIPEPVYHVWAAGKLKVYSEMSEPFCHFDHDVLLWNKLPERLLEADVFAQNRELCPYSAGWYGRCIKYGVPWVGSPYNAGIIGCNDLAFVHEYARGGLDAIHNPRNQAALSGRTGLDVSRHLEQLGIGCYARAKGRTVTTLLSPGGSEGERLGFTHYMHTAKYKPEHQIRVRRELKSRAPVAYESVKELTKYSVSARAHQISEDTIDGK